MPSNAARAISVYTTAPPRKYAEAPGTANNAAAMSPPVDDSAVAIVSWRAIRRLAIVSDAGSNAFTAIIRCRARYWSSEPKPHSQRGLHILQLAVPAHDVAN